MTEHRAARKISVKTIAIRAFPVVEAALEMRGFGGYLSLAKRVGTNSAWSRSADARFLFGPAWLIDVFDNAVTLNERVFGICDVAHHVGMLLDQIPYDDKLALDALTRLATMTEAGDD